MNAIRLSLVGLISVAIHLPAAEPGAAVPAPIDLTPTPGTFQIVSEGDPAPVPAAPITLSPWPEPKPVKIWSEGPKEPEGFNPKPEGLAPDKGDGVQRVASVNFPEITVYSPGTPNGTAVVVCPGGGYNILAIEHEGTQVCSWLNSIGVTAVLLKYRVPRRDAENPSREPLADAQQAIRVVRQHAAAWKINPDRIGILGFSAGGHLSIMTALHSEGEAAPNFAIPIYPAYLIDEKGDGGLLPEIAVTDTSPPMCFIHAGDDRHSAVGSALIYLELKKRDIPAELHIYAKGGHGFGMRENGQPVNDWPARVTGWFSEMGWLE